MLYFSRLEFVTDGHGDNFDAVPSYGVVDGFGFFAELGQDYRHAWQAYHNMLRTLRRLGAKYTNERAKIAQHYYNMRDLEPAITFSERYAVGEFFPDFSSEYLLNETINRLRRGDIDLIEDEL